MPIDSTAWDNYNMSVVVFFRMLLRLPCPRQRQLPLSHHTIHPSICKIPQWLIPHNQPQSCICKNMAIHQTTTTNNQLNEIRTIILKGITRPSKNWSRFIWKYLCDLRFSCRWRCVYCIVAIIYQWAGGVSNIRLKVEGPLRLIMAWKKMKVYKDFWQLFFLWKCNTLNPCLWGFGWEWEREFPVSLYSSHVTHVLSKRLLNGYGLLHALVAATQIWCDSRNLFLHLQLFVQALISSPQCPFDAYAECAINFGIASFVIICIQSIQLYEKLIVTHYSTL